MVQVALDQVLSLSLSHGREREYVAASDLDRLRIRPLGNGLLRQVAEGWLSLITY